MMAEIIGGLWLSTTVVPRFTCAEEPKKKKKNGGAATITLKVSSLASPAVARLLKSDFKCYSDS